MKFKYKKKLQRQLNKIVKNANAAVARDNLWRGRFELRQMADTYESYSDHSGGCLYVRIRALDKKTNEFCDFYMEYHSPIFGWYEVSRIINDFIIDFCKVWETEDRNELYNDNTDYTKLPSNYQREKAPEWCRSRRI